MTDTAVKTENQELVEAYSAGHSLKRCAAQFGMSHYRVRQVLLTLTVPLHPRGRPKGHSDQSARAPRAPSPPHRLLDELVALREQGETLEAIGRRFGFSRQAAHQILQKARPR